MWILEGFSEGLFKPSNRPLLLCLSCVSLTFILRGQDRVASRVYSSSREHMPSLTASVSQLSLQPLISSALLSLWSTAIWSVVSRKQRRLLWYQEDKLQVRGVIMGLGSWVQNSHIVLAKSLILKRIFPLPCCSVWMGLGCHTLEIGLEKWAEGRT